MFGPEAVAGYAVDAVFTVINLLVAYLILKRFLFKPLLKVLRNRRSEIETGLAQAEVKMNDADTRLAVARERLDKSSQEAEALLASARAQADAQSEVILNEARQEAANILSRADAEIERMRTTLLNEARNEIADLSIAVAAKVIGHVLDESRQHELVGKLLHVQMLPIRNIQDGRSGEVNRDA